MAKCHELRDHKELLAKYLADWMKDTLDMTASVDEDFKDLNYKQEVHPSTKKFSEVDGKDYGFDKALCQKSFQYHKCNKFCMRP